MATSAARAAPVAGESSATAMASLPLPGSMGSPKDNAPVSAPAAPRPTGRVQVSGSRWSRSHFHPARAPTPRATSTGTSATMTAGVHHDGAACGI